MPRSTDIRPAIAMQDDEPITAEWWQNTFGGAYIVKIIGPYCMVRDADGSVSLVQTGDPENATMCKLPHIKTQGDVKELWKVLRGEILD